MSRYHRFADPHWLNPGRLQAFLGNTVFGSSGFSRDMQIAWTLVNPVLPLLLLEDGMASYLASLEPLERRSMRHPYWEALRRHPRLAFFGSVTAKGHRGLNQSRIWRIHAPQPGADDRIAVRLKCLLCDEYLYAKKEHFRGTFLRGVAGGGWGDTCSETADLHLTTKHPEYHE